MSADLQFKQLIDRVLRCREAEDEAKADTKEVYAELKGLGYDKTAAGALVGELRKKDKNPDQFAERNATLDLYRDAYERAGGSLAHTHTREANGRREGNDEGAQGQGPGVAGSDRDGGTVSRTVDCEDEDGRSGHVGREARHEIAETDSGAFAAVKAQGRLANVADVEPPLSTSLPANVPQQADSAPEVAPPPTASGATLSPASRIPTDAGGHPSIPSTDAGAGSQAADTADHSNAKSVQAATLSDAEVPAFLKHKDGCLDQSGCRVKGLSVLCSRCASERATKLRAA